MRLNEGGVYDDVPQNAVGFAGMAWPKTPYIYELNLWEKLNDLK